VGLYFSCQFEAFSRHGTVVPLMADMRLLLHCGTTGSMGRQGCALEVKAMELSRDRPRHPLHFLTSPIAEAKQLVLPSSEARSSMQQLLHKSQLS
jgi:hypothetical protein